MLLGILENAGVGETTESLLAAARSHSDSTVRWVAIEVLGLRGEQAARAPLLGLLETDPDRFVRETTALALARLGEERGVEALRDFMNAPTDPQRQLFLSTRLAELGDPSGYRYVVQAAQAENGAFRAAAAEAVVPFLSAQPRDLEGSPGPAALLLGLAEDESPAVRSAFLTYLPMAVRHGLEMENARAAGKRLALSDPDPEIRERAKRLLAALQVSEQREGRGGAQ
jgi:HEAT repeat protein